mgnify:CR=1 FL=1
MQQDEPKTTARTYRFDTPFYKAMRSFREAMRPKPSEKELLQAAMRDFMERSSRASSKKPRREQ